MKAHIKTQTIFGIRYEEKEMTAKDLSNLRREIVNNLMTWFKWDNYKESFQHLLYYAELDGEAYVYTSGWLMDDKEFDDLVANRKGIGYVGAKHRNTGMFGR